MLQEVADMEREVEGKKREKRGRRAPYWITDYYTG